MSDEAPFQYYNGKFGVALAIFTDETKPVNGGTLKFFASATATAPSTKEADWTEDIPAADKPGEWRVWYKVVPDAAHTGGVAATELTVDGDGEPDPVVINPAAVSVSDLTSVLAIKSNAVEGDNVLVFKDGETASDLPAYMSKVKFALADNTEAATKLAETAWKSYDELTVPENTEDTKVFVKIVSAGADDNWATLDPTEFDKLSVKKEFKDAAFKVGDKVVPEEGWIADFDSNNTENNKIQFDVVNGTGTFPSGTTYTFSITDAAGNKNDIGATSESNDGNSITYTFTKANTFFITAKITGTGYAPKVITRKVVVKNGFVSNGTSVSVSGDTVVNDTFSWVAAGLVDTSGSSTTTEADKKIFIDQQVVAEKGKINDDGSYTVGAGAVVRIGEKNDDLTSNNSGATAIEAVGTGAELKIDPNADQFSNIQVSGEGSKIDFDPTDSNTDITLKANQVAFVAVDGGNVAVKEIENGNVTKTVFYKARSQASVEVPQAALENGSGIKNESGESVELKAINVDDTVNASTVESGTTHSGNINISTANECDAFATNAIVANENNVIEKPKHVSFSDAVTVRAPLGIADNKMTRKTSLFKKDVNNSLRFFDAQFFKISDALNPYNGKKTAVVFSTTHFCDWLVAPASGLTAEIDTSGSIVNGTIDLSTQGTFDAGSDVGITSTPDPGYALSELYYVYTADIADPDAEKHTITGNSFTMPGENVTIYAEFAKSGSSVDYEEVVQNGVTYNVYSDHAEVASVDTSKTSVAIQDKVGGKNVTVIAENAFNGCADLTSVTIPATVKTIEASAFWGCTALAEVTIPKTVTSIDKDAFKKCTALKTVKGVNGSAAETFAKSAGLTFKESDGSETPAATLAKVTNVKIDNSGNVTWDAAEGAVEYKVFKKIGKYTYNTGWITKTEHKFASVPTVNFEVYVAARSAEKKVTYSDHLKVTGSKPLGTATNVKVTDKGGVSWTAAANAKYYKVVKVVNGKEYSKTVKTGTSTTISVPVSDYKVYVTAVGQYNTTTNSKIKNVTVKNALGYVNEVTVDKNGKVTWTKASNAVEYKVGKVMNGKTYWTKKVTGTSVTIKPAKKDYQVFVVAFNKDVKKTWGAKNLVSVTDPGTVIDAKVSGKTVTWSAVKNAVKYKVNKVVTDKDGKSKTYGGKEVTTTSYTLKNTPKKGDRFYVVAYDAKGKKTLGWSVTIK